MHVDKRCLTVVISKNLHEGLCLVFGLRARPTLICKSWQSPDLEQTLIKFLVGPWVTVLNKRKKEAGLAFCKKKPINHKTRLFIISAIFVDVWAQCFQSKYGCFLLLEMLLTQLCRLAFQANDNPLWFKFNASDISWISMRLNFCKSELMMVKNSRSKIRCLKSD